MAECVEALRRVMTGSQPLALHDGRVVTREEFIARALALASRLPDAPQVVNVCDQRLDFLVVFLATLLRGGTTLLPSSRAPRVLEELEAEHPRALRLAAAEPVCENAVRLRPAGQMPADWAAPQHAALIGHTSGTTGHASAHRKRWGDLLAVTVRNAAAIRGALTGFDENAVPFIVATVPAQHMYGIELSVMLPLAAGMAVHSGRPFFPADVSSALASVPAPRVLVSTPVHLRAMLEARLAWPTVAAIVSATAPLDPELAIALEAQFDGTLVEMFGSTETCVIASRRTTVDEHWTLYEGAALSTLHGEVARVRAPWLDGEVPLQDQLEMLDADRFVLRGRHSDLIEIAGKRASLAELTRRLLAVPGVEDAVVFQLPADGAASVRRITALVVSRTRSAQDISTALSLSIDPVFMPRPLRLVASLPRNEVGKLRRSALLAAARTRG